MKTKDGASAKTRSRSRATDSDEEAIKSLARALESVPPLKEAESDILSYVRVLLLSKGLTDKLAGEPKRLLSGEIGLEPLSPDDLLKEARLRGEARRQVFDEEMWDSTYVAGLVGSRSSNPRQYANDNRRRGKLIGLAYMNRYLYPAFQFDADRGRIRPEVARINRLLGAGSDPWGAASWWISPNAMLGGKAPKELIGDRVRIDELLRAAEGVTELVG
ncbi:MAG: hypothetical protein C4521_03125 [Actinobacteria bacterium]|nr:MAG: hypothetical protein C4521_03125 [Actinomycetota bacterium]